ncbi:4-hydroxy-2-oxoheptanedioate aldolase [Roseiarcus fermentans]|uniref:4-hydroxy-2-oxoheptanedioate aldolase n=1 Tax=Roseiarcus fermentans TaxID=1473586 RepID=A0A366F3M4_9HYPH|nr:aldolase/citrate lyase family protein [Roseiarcus fermentans]RBP09238.1 4-hydroxy-2-oxoheptanedioate aldolase [Roseiarcus fermentans]
MTETVVGKLIETLAGGAPVFSAWVGMNEPAVAEALAREAFDAVILDMQHGALDFAGACQSILAVALAGLPAIVRTPVGEFATASRLIDAGAAGVIAPMINSRADAEAFAAFAKFPPLGERSWGPRAALPLSGLDTQAYLAGANRLTQAIAMIETREALAALDDILAVDGVDGVFIGPADLSIALSDGAKWDPRGAAVIEAAGHVVARARAHGKYAGMFCYDGADAHAMAALGFRLCSIGSDGAMLRAAARGELAAARGTPAGGPAGGPKTY